MTNFSKDGRLFTINGSCSDAVVALAQTLGLQLEVLPRGSHNDELIAANPLRTVPTYVNADGYVLTETAAILNYLARTHAPSIMPQDAISLARLDEMMGFIATSVYAAFLLHFRPDRSALEESAYPAIRAKAKASIETALDELQRRVGDSHFVLGTEISTADFLALVMLRWADRVNPDFLQTRLSLQALLLRMEAHVSEHSMATAAE